MLDFLFSTSVSDTLTIWSTLVTIFSSLVLGFIISFVYMLTHKKEGYSKSFTVTLIMLPTIIAIIILLVGNNVARAFSLAGAFSLIRFRSSPGDPKDIAYIFFTLAAGLGCGIGFVGYAAVFTIILSMIMVILQLSDYGSSKNIPMKLKILIPEDVDYEVAFKETLDTYTKSHNLIRLKTSDFGALYEVTYIVDLQDSVNQKEFIDELRSKNSNLLVSLAKLNINENNNL